MNSVRNAQELKHIKSKATTQTTISKQRKKVKGKKKHEVRLNRMYRRTKNGSVLDDRGMREAAQCPCVFVQASRISSLFSSSFLFISLHCLSISFTSVFFVFFFFSCVLFPGDAIVVARHSYCRTSIYICAIHRTAETEEKKSNAIMWVWCWC